MDPRPLPLYARGVDRRRACQLLGVEPGYDRVHVQRGFRSKARGLHPDHGGRSEDMSTLIEARDTLLRSLERPAGAVIIVDDSGLFLKLRRSIRSFRHKPAKRVV